MKRKKASKYSDLDLIISKFRAGEDSCPHFMECGGCYMRQLSYGDQLRVKDEYVRGLFEGLLGGRLPEIYEGILPSPDVDGYRNKMEFSFGNMEKDGPLTLGLHRRGSFYDIVPVPGCRIVDEDFRKILALTMEFFRERGVSFFHKKSHEGYLRHLLVRKARFTGEILVDIVTAGVLSGSVAAGETELLQSYVNHLASAKYNGTLAGILHTVNNSVADAIIDEGTELLYGKDHFYEEILGLRFKITPFSFFQTNSAGAEVLYGTARDFLQSAMQRGEGDDGAKAGTLFDLYCGTGTIAQIFSPSFERVTGVEIVEEAVRAARENAALNGIEGCSFIAGDVLKVVGELTEKPDAIVLDPPRDGIHPKALPKIIDFGVDNILYIACKPKSLARDLPMLMEHGYRPVRMAAVDMFPATANVEVVCMLTNTLYC